MQLRPVLWHRHHPARADAPLRLRLPARKTDLQQYRKQGEDLTKQLDHPFEHEEKLATATKRQQEIITALDITKNQASAKLDAGEEQSTEAIEDKPTQSLRAKKKTASAMKV